jgi:hypothetical protein
MRHRRKICKTCGVEKTLRQFYRHKSYADGHMNSCKRCKIQQVRENMELKEEHYRELKRRISARPKYRQQRAAYARTEHGRLVQRRAWRRYYRVKRAMQGHIVKPYRRGELHA